MPVGRTGRIPVPTTMSRARIVSRAPPAVATSTSNTDPLHSILAAVVPYRTGALTRSAAQLK